MIYYYNDNLYSSKQNLYPKKTLEKSSYKNFYKTSHYMSSDDDDDLPCLDVPKFQSSSYKSTKTKDQIDKVKSGTFTSIFTCF